VRDKLTHLVFMFDEDNTEVVALAVLGVLVSLLMSRRDIKGFVVLHLLCFLQLADTNKTYA